MTLASGIQPHLNVMKHILNHETLNLRPRTASADSQGDGVDTGHSFGQTVKNVLEHPATSAAAGAAITGVPVLLLTGNPVAAAIAGAGGAVAGLAVNLGVRLVVGLMQAFENIG